MKIIATTAFAALVLAGCGGGTSSAKDGVCASTDVTFEAGESIVPRGAIDTILKTVEARSGDCADGMIVLESYRDDAGDELARMRATAIKNLLTVRAEMPNDAMTMEIVDAPDAGKAGTVSVRVEKPE